MSAPLDIRERDARFHVVTDEEFFAELRAEAAQRRLARRVRRFELLAMRLVLGFAASLGLVCLASQIVKVIA